MSADFFHNYLGAYRRRMPTAWADVKVPTDGVSSKTSPMLRLDADPGDYRCGCAGPTRAEMRIDLAADGKTGYVRIKAPELRPVDNPESYEAHLVVPLGVWLGSWLLQL